MKTGIQHLPGETGSQRVQGLKVVRYDFTVTAKGVLHEDYVSLLGKATARRLCALSIVQGTGTGKVATFSLPYTELEAVPVQDSRDDIALVNLSWRVRDDTSSNAFSLSRPVSKTGNAANTAGAAAPTRLPGSTYELSIDLPRGRSYLPAEDLRHFGLDVESVQALRTGSSPGMRTATPTLRAFRDLIRFQVARARSLLERGRPLIDAVGVDLSMELQLTYLSGHAMLDKIEGLLEEILRTRPTLSRSDRARVLARTLGRRMPSLLTRELGFLGGISAFTGLDILGRSGHKSRGGWPGWIDR